MPSLFPASSDLTQGIDQNKRKLGLRILVVAQLGAEGERQLPQFHDEVTVIRTLPAKVTVVEADDRTRNTVLTGLKETAWAHFACRRKQPPTEPFKHHFSLQTRDTPLPLIDIITTSLSQAELVILSACHSAVGDESTPDEGIHLTARMLFTGFQSVVGRRRRWQMWTDR